MIQSKIFWLCLVLLSSGFCAFLLSIISIIRERSIRRKNLAEPEEKRSFFTNLRWRELKLGKIDKVKIRNTIAQTIVSASIFYIGFLAGFSYRDLQQRDHTIHKENIRVVQRLSFDKYLMKASSDKKLYVWKFCSSYIPNFVENSLIEEIKYEQTPECINIGERQFYFRIKRDSVGNPVVSENIFKGE